MLVLAYPGTTPDYWLQQIVDDDQLVATALDMIGEDDDD